MSDRITSFTINTGEETQALNLSRRMALLKQLLQASVQRSIIPVNVQNYNQNSAIAINEPTTSQRALLFQHQQQLCPYRPPSVQLIHPQPVQQQIQLRPRQQNPAHSQQANPVAVAPQAQQRQPTRRSSRDAINVPQLNQKFTLRQDASPTVSFNACLRIAEIEEFGKHILDTCQGVDKYIYDALVLKETLVPTLEAKNATLKRDLDELLKANEKLSEDKRLLFKEVNNLRFHLTHEQAKVSDLAKTLVARDKHLVDLSRTLEKVKQELNNARDELETKVDDLEKLKLKVQRNEDMIRNLEDHQKQLRGKRVSWKKAFKKRAKDMARLQATIKFLHRELNKLKQAVKNREKQIDHLKADIDVMKLEALDMEEEGFKIKQERDNLKEYIAKLEACLAKEIQMRKDLEEKCPHMINRCLDKSANIIEVHMDKKEMERKRHADPPVTEPVSPTKKRAVANSNSGEQQQNGRIKMKMASKREKEQDKQSKREKDGHGIDNSKRGIACNKVGNVVVEEIWLTDVSEDEENIISNQKQVQGGSKVKITLPQWKMLQETAASTVTLPNNSAARDNIAPKKTSVSVSNRNNLVMKFKMNNK